MTPSETTVLLSAAAAVDNRIVTEVTAREWARALEPYELEECLTALRLFRKTHSDYLQPAHIVERVKIARTERLMREAASRGIDRGRRGPGHASRDVALIKAQLRSQRANRASAEPKDPGVSA